MRTQKYALAGGDVPAHLKGAVIQIRIAETVSEQTQLAGGNEALGVAKFNDGYVIAAQGVARRASAKEGATSATVQEAIDKFVLAERAAGSPREVKPETRADRTARDQANKNFERALSDESFLKQGLKLGFIDQAAFDSWKADREIAKQAAAKAAEIDKAQAATK